MGCCFSSQPTSLSNPYIRPSSHQRSFQVQDTRMQEARQVQPVRSYRDEPMTPVYERFVGLTIGRNDGEQHEPPQIRFEDRMPPSKPCLVEEQVLEEKQKSSEIVPILEDDEEFCPICLEGYNMENPKLSIPCKHDYHLPCMLEWMERSCLCPICSQVIVLE